MTTEIDRKTLRFKSVNFKGLAPGARLVVTGAVHGNETCGTQAITRILAEVNSGKLPIVAGEVTFVPVTNPLAYAKGERAGDRNLNRNLSPTKDPKDFEDLAANWLCPILARHDVLLDLHSTRGKTQAFAMLGPKDNAGDIEPFKHSAHERAMARILGVKRYVEGWLGTYAKGVERRVKSGLGSGLNTDPKYGVGTTEYMRTQGGYAITLECGQHEDPQSPEVAYRAIRNVLAHLGITGEEKPKPVEEWEALKIDDVIDRAHEDDKFARAWASFDTVKRGDLIGTRADGTELRAESDGWIVFPDVGAKPGHEWYYFAKANPAVWN
jgi:predicted deacylase